MGNHGSNNWETIHGRHVCENLLSAPDVDTLREKEREIKQRRRGSKPRHAVKTLHQPGEFLYQNELEKKSRQVKLQRRNQCRKNAPAVNMQRPEQVDDNDWGQSHDTVTRSLSNPAIPIRDEKCKITVTRNVNDSLTWQSNKSEINNSTLEPDTAGSVHRLKKCLSGFCPSKLIRRKTRKERRSVSRRRLSVATGQASYATMNHAPLVATNYTPLAATHDMPSANTTPTPSAATNHTATNHTPSVASRRRFCVLNKRDKNTLRAQLSIWFPFICHKPTLKALKDGFIRMKCTIFQELRKLEIIDFNKHITEAKEQRHVFRKEHLRERSSKCKPVYFISSVVPACQKRICSLHFDRERTPITPVRDIREHYVKERKPINSKANATNNPERCPFTGNERHWRHSLMYFDCEKLQMAAQCEIPTYVNDHEKMKPSEVTETKQFYIPEWFQKLLSKESIINIHPTFPGELIGPSAEIKQLIGCQRRLQLGHLFHSSDFYTGDGRLLISVREQDATPPGDMGGLLSTNTQTTSSESHIQQTEITFERDPHEDKRILQVAWPLKYIDLNSASKSSQGSCSRVNRRNSVQYFRRRLGKNQKSTISNFKRDSYKKLQVNTVNKPDFRTQQDSRASCAEYTESKFGNYVLRKGSCDKKQSWKGVYINQPPVSNEESGDTCLAVSDSVCSPVCPELSSEVVGKIARNILSETKVVTRNTAKRIQNRRRMRSQNMIPELHDEVRNKSTIFFKGRLVNNVNTDPSRTIPKGDASCPHKQSICVLQQRSRSCGHDLCLHLSRNIRKDRSWVSELRHVFTSDVADEEVNTATFEAAKASAQVITNTLPDNDMKYLVKDSNPRAETYSKLNKNRGDHEIMPEQGTRVDKMNKSNSSVHGIQGVFECPLAIVVDEVMDSEVLCVTSNAESKLDPAALTRLDPSTEAPVGHGVSLADNVTDLKNLCMATDDQSEISQVILVQSGEDTDSSVATEAIVVGDNVDLQAVSMSRGTEPNWDQTEMINLNKDMKSKVVNELNLMDGVIQSPEICMGISTKSKLDQYVMAELCENVEFNTFTEVDGTKRPDYKHMINFHVNSELNPEQPQDEKEYCISCLNSDNEHLFTKSLSVIDRKTPEKYYNNSAKMSEPETALSPLHDINCLENNSSENDRILFNLREHQFQSKKSTSVYEKTNNSNEKNESNCVAASNSGRMSSRESLIDFIKEQWRSCKTSVADQVKYEQQTDPLKSNHFSPCTVRQRTSAVLCPERKPFFFGDTEDTTWKEHDSIHKEQSYETMCLERRENYLKICQTLENYYESSSQDDFNSISSISDRNLQARQDGFNSISLISAKNLQARQDHVNSISSISARNLQARQDHVNSISSISAKNLQARQDDVNSISSISVRNLQARQDDVNSISSISVRNLQARQDDVNSISSISVRNLQARQDDVNSISSISVRNLQARQHDVNSISSISVRNLQARQDEVNSISSISVKNLQARQDDVNSISSISVKNLQARQDDVNSISSISARNLQARQDDVNSTSSISAKNLQARQDDVNSTSSISAKNLQARQDDVNSISSISARNLQARQDDVNSISSISARNLQARQEGLVNSLRKINMSEIPANALLLADKIDETPSRSKMLITKNAPFSVSHESYLQPDDKTVNSFIESARKSLNAGIKQTTSPQTCSIKVRKLSEIKIVPEVKPGLQDHGTFGMPQNQISQPPSSACADTTNQNVLSNTTDLVSSMIVIPAGEREWLPKKIKSLQPIHANKSREGVCILSALDTLLERYFRLIEEFQRRLENCYTKASKYDKRRKSTQRCDNKFKDVKSTRQKKQRLSESALNLFQSLGREHFNSQVTVEDAYLEKLKHGEFMKSLAWNCSVNNKQDSPSDSVSSDVDLIAPPSKKYLNKRQQGTTETVSGNDPQLNDALNQEANATISNEPKLLNDSALASADDNILGSPVADDIASPAEKASTSRRGSGKMSRPQILQAQPSRMPVFGTNRESVDSGTLPRLTSRLSVAPEYPDIQQAPADSSSSRYRKQGQVSDRGSSDYFTRDVGTIAPQSQSNGTQRKGYLSVYDKDSNNRQTFLHDDSTRRMRTAGKQESYYLATAEEEYITQPVNSYRHMSPEYVDSKWPPVSSKIPELRSKGKSVTNTDTAGKYYSASKDTRGYYNGEIMPREQPDRREFVGKAKYVPTFNSQSGIPDYCLNQTRGLARPNDSPPTPARRAPVLTVGQEHEKANKKQDADPCQLSQAQVWFRDLCERVHANSKSSGAVSQHPRCTHEDNTLDGNLCIDARICVTPTICCTGDDCQRNRRNTLGVRESRGSPSKEHGSNFLSREVDNRLLDPCKNYKDIALLENPAKYDSNTRRRPEGFQDYIYSQGKPAEATVEEKNAPFSDADLENLQPVRLTERRSKANIGTQFEINPPIERRLENPRQVNTRSNLNTIKECANVCIQTCACISKPNGTCLCGCISMNETIWPNVTNEFLAPNPVENTDQKLNFKSVFIQTCDDEHDENIMERPPLQKGKNMVEEIRSRQRSPAQLKCRNKKCQIGRSVQCKNEYTSVGASLSNAQPCKTVSTHCHQYDRKTGPNMSTTRTKCVQTCSFSVARNNKRPLREEKTICCKCKQKLDNVMANQIETPDLSSETATDSYENGNDKECQCDTFQDYTMPELDPAIGRENVHPYTKYHTQHPYVQNYACKSGQEGNVLASLVIEDCSDEEWGHGKETQPIPRYQPSPAERMSHHTTDSGNACVLSHELTEQISGIIRNSRLLQQQAVLLRNKCKYLEGQGWASINQNRHEALSPRKSHKCSNVLRCHNFKNKPDKLMDRNSNANTEFEQELDQENIIKYDNKLGCRARSMSNQWPPYINDHVTRNAGSSYRKFIRKCLGHKEKLQCKQYFLCTHENKNHNWNARPRKSPADVNGDTSSQMCTYTHPQNERYYVNDPSEEAYQYLSVHFPDLYRSPPSKNNSHVAADMHGQCYNCRGDVQKKGSTKQKQLCGQYSGIEHTPDITNMTPESSVCLKEQNSLDLKFCRNVNLPVQMAIHDESRTKSQNNAKSAEETTETTHNGEAICTMIETPCLHQDITRNSAYSNVTKACHNEFGQSFNQEGNSLHMARVNMSYSHSALKENYWQLAYKIGSISGIRQANRHAWNQDGSHLNKQRQRKAFGEDGGHFVRHDPAVSKDLTRVPSITDAHKETHSVGTMVSLINLQQPFQEQVSSLEDKKFTASFPMTASGSSYYEDTRDACMSCSGSSGTVSPDTSVPHSAGFSSCPIVSNSPPESVQVKKQSHSVYQSGDDLTDISKHQEGILKLKDGAEQSPDAPSSNASVMSIRIVPNDVNCVHVLKETFLGAVSADITATQRNKSASEVAQHLFRSDSSQVLKSGTFRQGDNQLQLWEKSKQSVSLAMTRFKCESSPLVENARLQREQCLPKAAIGCARMLTNKANVLDSQDSNLGIDDIPWDSTVSECETIAREPTQLKDQALSKAILYPCSKNECKAKILINRPLPLGKQDKRRSYLRNSTIKCSGSKCGGPLLPKWESVVCIDNAVLPTNTTVNPHPPTSSDQPVRTGAPRQITLGGALKQFEVSMSSSEDIKGRLDLQEESGNKQIVCSLNSPECLREQRIRKDEVKCGTAASKTRLCEFLDTQDPSTSSKKFGYIPDRSNTRRSRHLDLHGNSSTTIASHRKYSRNNTTLSETSSQGTVMLRNNPLSQQLPAHKTNDHITRNKWRTCFLGCAEVIEASDQTVLIEGAYIRRHSSLQNHEDFQMCKMHTKKVERERSDCMDTRPKVVQFRLALSRHEGSGDSTDFNGLYSRQLMTSDSYFNWEFIF